ncbi:chorismate mutase [Candidatus Kaiserbacteria bacterium]|nr:chorismate mutase [Candidatus Kaiserbacteria bacterium]
MPDDTLQNLRNSIDAVDHKIIAALAQRAELVREIGAYKRARGTQPLDDTRFKNMIADRVAAGESLSLPDTFVKDIFTRIHDESLREQERSTNV